MYNISLPFSDKSFVEMMTDDENQYIFLFYWSKKISVFIQTISLGAHLKTFLAWCRQNTGARIPVVESWLKDYGQCYYKCCCVFQLYLRLLEQGLITKNKEYMEKLPFKSKILNRNMSKVLISYGELLLNASNIVRHNIRISKFLLRGIQTEHYWTCIQFIITNWWITS